jgi:endo-1,3-1,4-beta-glycanase ExoK
MLTSSCAHSGSAVRGSGPFVEESGSFVDEFGSGRLDTSRWVVSDGWNNGLWHGCTWSAENVMLAENTLRLIVNDAARQNRSFSCGEIQTLGFHGYGVYEARLRSMPGSGLVTAFFTYTGGPQGRSHEEVDFEFLGKSPTEVQLNFFRNGRGGHEKMIALGFDATGPFHDYAFVWEKESVRWFVDGRQVHEIRQDVPVAPAKIYLNVWNGGAFLGSWAGSFRYPGSPIVAEVERVAFTAEGTRCQFPGSVACQLPGGR